VPLWIVSIARAELWRDSMMTYRRIDLEQYDEIVQLFMEEAPGYLLRTMELMQLTFEQMEHLVRTIGEVYGIYQHELMAGFYWIEERGNILHLHALVVKGEYQGKGIGTQVLEMLAAKYRQQMVIMELGVHESNARAKSLYERLGYRAVRHLDELGFYIMQKTLVE
jgi:ribosomal protein S18 acetylase RimI-like enzyme